MRWTLTALVLFAGGTTAEPPEIVELRPPVSAPCQLSSLPAGHLFYGTSGTLFMRVDPVDYEPDDPNHLLYGVSPQPESREGYRFQRRLGQVSLVGGGLASCGLRPQVYVVDVGRGVLMLMPAGEWVRPADEVRIEVKTYGQFP